MKESILQEQKTKRMKELHDSQQNMAIKKLLKRKKEAEEQAQLVIEEILFNHSLMNLQKEVRSA